MLDSTQTATLARLFLALAERADELDHADAVLAVLDGPAPLDTLADRVKSAARADVAETLDTLAGALAAARETAAETVRDPLYAVEDSLRSALDAVEDALRGSGVPRAEDVERVRHLADEVVRETDNAFEALDTLADPVELLESHGEPGVLDDLVARVRIAVRLDAYNGHVGWNAVHVTLAGLDLLDHVAGLAGITLDPR